MRLDPRVALGATVLDQESPEWPWLVDIYRLDIGSLFDCILGQIFGDYSTAMTTLFPLYGLGFYLGEIHGFYYSNHLLYSELEQEWANLILFRRGELRV